MVRCRSRGHARCRPPAPETLRCWADAARSPAARRASARRPSTIRSAICERRLARARRAPQHVAGDVVEARDRAEHRVRRVVADAAPGESRSRRRHWRCSPARTRCHARRARRHGAPRRAGCWRRRRRSWRRAAESCDRSGPRPARRARTRPPPARRWHRVRPPVRRSARAASATRAGSRSVTIRSAPASVQVAAQRHADVAEALHRDPQAFEIRASKRVRDRGAERLEHPVGGDRQRLPGGRGRGRGVRGHRAHDPQIVEAGADVVGDDVAAARAGRPPGPSPAAAPASSPGGHRR